MCLVFYCLHRFVESSHKKRQTDKSLSHPQCVVDGVLFLILGHHQCEGVCPCAGQPHLGQVMWAVDADAVDVRRGVGCGRSLLIVNKPESSRRVKLWE